jgi:Raf kinase inhibitor-like YbhB/YbcL family protein
MRARIATTFVLIGLSGLVGPALAAMTLTSSDIKEGAVIAAAQIYPRCGGQNVSPQLSWGGTPAGAKSLVLTMIDLDVKPTQWSHWIVVGLPPETTALARGVSTLPAPAQSVVSNFGDAGYAGPCPPKGTGVHHYQITIWALPDASVSIEADEKATAVSAALSKVAIDKATLTGSVTR